TNDMWKMNVMLSCMNYKENRKGHGHYASVQIFFYLLLLHQQQFAFHKDNYHHLYNINKHYISEHDIFYISQHRQCHDILISRITIRNATEYSNITSLLDHIIILHRGGY
ncbi:hypothetical protein ACJX0J_016260, partial [Zea mays]